MGDRTGIAWTDATWNPLRGCSRVSEGCRRCYAEAVAARFSGPGQPYEGLAERAAAGPRWTGEVRLVPGKLDQPLRWRKPRMVFVASMSDPFHSEVSDKDLDRIFAVMALCPTHTFQSLTKRPQRMLEYLTDPATPFRIQQAMDAVAVDEDMRGHEEKWAIVPGWDDYAVSTMGRVRSYKIGGEPRELKQSMHGGGYLQVTLCSLGRPVTRLVHQLVLEAFVGSAGLGEESRHRNGDKQDNRIANLSWGTKADNMLDAARHGTAGAWMKSQGKLDASTVQIIRERRKAGALLDELAEEYGIDKRQVCAIAKGKIYKAARLAWPLTNVWLGVSVEDQATADERIPLLLQCPAAVRWVSAEPLLGPIDLVQAVNQLPWLDSASWKAGGLDWVVVGGESGPGARHCDVEWIRGIIGQCQAAGVPVFVKQLGARPTGHYGERVPEAHLSADLDGSENHWILRDRKGGDPAEWPEELRLRQYPRV